MLGRLLARLLKTFLNKKKPRPLNREFLTRRRGFKRDDRLTRFYKKYFVGKEEKEKKPRTTGNPSGRPRTNFTRDLLTLEFHNLPQEKRDKIGKAFNARMEQEGYGKEILSFYSMLKKRMERTSAKYLKEGKLSYQQGKFVEEYSEFFSFSKPHKQQSVIEPIPIGKGVYPKRKSSWLLAFLYHGKRGSREFGGLLVKMRAGKVNYYFPSFPYKIYVMLITAKDFSIGRFGGRKGLGKYGMRKPVYSSKYIYKGYRKRQKAIFNRHKGIS